MDFTGLNVWQSATLYIYFTNREEWGELDLLIEHIEEMSISGPAVGGFFKRWKSLDKAIYEKNKSQISSHAFPPDNGGEPWPDQWAHIANNISHDKLIAKFLQYYFSTCRDF